MCVFVLRTWYRGKPLTPLWRQLQSFSRNSIKQIGDRFRRKKNAPNPYGAFFFFAQILLAGIRFFFNFSFVTNTLDEIGITSRGTVGFKIIVFIDDVCYLNLTKQIVCCVDAKGVFHTAIIISDVIENRKKNVRIVLFYVVYNLLQFRIVVVCLSVFFTSTIF